ncbi:MAG: hypothetical protein EA391_01375 [Balneolaceae bacterium]|nr:MAG: hypothetical protein EA391_01375 [Balneolaceae bacterium]
MLRNLLIIITISIFTISCANRANQYLVEDFVVDSSDVSVSLLIIEHDYLFETFPDHVFGSLRPAERMIFDQRMAGIFASRTHANVEGVLNSTTLTETEFDVREFSLPNSQISMIAPKKGSQLQNGELSTRFVVVLDQFHFTPYQAEVGGDSYAGHENQIEERLRFESKYLIWDNETGDAVAWGRLNTNQRLLLQNQNETYTGLLNDAFSRLVQVSPFPARG